MLDEVLDFFRHQNKTKTLNQLARDLGLEPSALEGILEYLVKKGKLKVDYQGSGPADSCRRPVKGACISCPLRRKKKDKDIKYYYLA